jgi:hypothetical protein
VLGRIDMECSCTIDVDGDGGPDVYRDKIQTARKQHQCSECCRIIEKGEKYEYVFGVWDSPSVYKTCEDCLSIRNQFFEEGWLFTQIWENFQDNFNYIGAVVPESCISALTPGSRARVCEWIENGWEDE